MVQWGNPTQSLRTYCLAPLPSAGTFGKRRKLLLLFKDTATTESTPQSRAAAFFMLPEAPPKKEKNTPQARCVWKLERGAVTSWSSDHPSIAGEVEG